MWIVSENIFMWILNIEILVVSESMLLKKECVCQIELLKYQYENIIDRCNIRKYSGRLICFYFLSVFLSLSSMFDFW